MDVVFYLAYAKGVYYLYHHCVLSYWERFIASPVSYQWFGWPLPLSCTYFDNWLPAIFSSFYLYTSDTTIVKKYRNYVPLQKTQVCIIFCFWRNTQVFIYNKVKFYKSDKFNIEISRNKTHFLSFALNLHFCRFTILKRSRHTFIWSFNPNIIYHRFWLVILISWLLILHKMVAVGKTSTKFEQLFGKKEKFSLFFH